MQQYFKISLFVLVILMAAYFRFVGLNWDQNQHLHPDERFLTMVTTSLRWPKDFLTYFNPKSSTLDPHNVGFSFYVYGTWPVILTKAIAELTGKGDYNQLALVGRILAGLIDLFTTILVFLVTSKIARSYRAGILAMFFYATTVTVIQLTHFFTVDPYLVFFTVLSFYFLLKLRDKHSRVKQVLLIIGLGISVGLSVGAKIQALLFLPTLALGLVIFLRKEPWRNKLILAGVLLLTGYLTLRLAYPYLFAQPSFFSFKLNPQTLANWQQLNLEYSAKTYAHTKSLYFPPATMFISAKNYLFPLENMILWGSGLAAGLATLISYIFLIWWVIKNRKDKQSVTIGILLFWITYFFLYQGQEFAKYLRYFYLLYPFLAIILGLALNFLSRKRGLMIVVLITCFINGLWALAFCRIYNQPNPRIAASEWIYQHIPAGTTIAGEEWDDGLPLCLPGSNCNQYERLSYPLYDPDTDQKWQEMRARIANTEYIILSSNRLYGSIMSVPDRLPETTKYYEALFNGTLGFVKVAEFTDRPNLPLPFVRLCLTPPGLWYGKVARKTQECKEPGLSFVDDYADESFTVYDHPKVIIFKRVFQNETIQ